MQALKIRPEGERQYNSPWNIAVPFTVIEMKIWRGEAYNERGEKQLADYLDRFDVQVGYMVSFCFNKNKVPGLKPPVKIGTRTLVEAVV